MVDHPQLQHWFHDLPILSTKMQTSISKPVSLFEIQRAVFDVHSLKYSGPDGAPPLLFKQFWHSVGGQISLVVFQIFETGHLLPALNENFIILIPNVSNPTSINHFRPISLCNTSYKIIAKNFNE